MLLPLLWDAKRIQIIDKLLILIFFICIKIEIFLLLEVHILDELMDRNNLRLGSKKT